MLIFALGCAAGKLFDDFDTSERQTGVDLPDGRGGCYHVTTVEFILRVLEHKRPVHEEVRMLHTGLGFFKFTPRRDERPDVWFQRFDSMLEVANRVVGLGLNVTLQSWMLLGLLQLTPRKWSDLLKELGHRLPREHHEHVRLQQGILRERVLENSVFDPRGGGGPRTSPGVRHYLIDEELGPRPMYMCLGDLGGSRHPVGTGPAISSGIDTPGADDDTVDVYDGQWLPDGVSDADSDCSIHAEQWGYENLHDPISAEEVRQLQRFDHDGIQKVCWTARKAIRRYRAAIGMFQPRGRTKGGRAKRRFIRNGGKPSGGKRRKGFYVEDAWISLDNITDESLEA